MESKVHVVISGKVQGVWFRASTKDKAEQLNIKGWVRNTSDGKVEAMFEGDEENVNEILKWCYQGPPLAEVENVKVKKQVPSNDLDCFSVRD